MQAHAEAARFDAAQCCADVPQQIGLTVQIADRQLALGGVLHFIECIGTLFDSDAVAIAYQLDQLCLLGLQYVSVFVRLTLCHFCLLLSLSVFLFFIAAHVPGRDCCSSRTATNRDEAERLAVRRRRIATSWYVADSASATPRDTPSELSCNRRRMARRRNQRNQRKARCRRSILGSPFRRPAMSSRPQDCDSGAQSEYSRFRGLRGVARPEL